MIKAIIGLGNPGPSFEKTRHNIGFKVLDTLATEESLSWKKKDNFLEAQWHDILLIKPQTFMNNSGQVIPYLQKKGITANEIIVVHDELEVPFGTIKTKLGGSHKGHNGLRSIIEKIGADFHRLRFGISRPEDRNDVPDYVLKNFSPNEVVELEDLMRISIEQLNTIKKKEESHEKNRNEHSTS